ncbi:nucleotidyltransferase domain-containing protein [Deinococcus sp. SL84]|uniref:nucleotidyltransferase domain-containing protein n=1 Tax=Deinococcus sp. SL84 TaxID=2994663 RepID=UPI0022738EA6|nr:nucleotidyltransferase [Deinococcus sp. SL84]MCY1704280.1 nucleotidyltransferase [Deinococcus sp. SL84]
MADIQRQFETFIDTIKLSEEETTLREKREAVLNALDRGLKRDFAKKNQTPPRYKHFNQGSYSLKTGIKPVDDGSDYDIDVGIVFAVDPDTYQDDPGIIKRWVRDALDGHTDDIRIKTPCVTVTYKAGYHVDLAVYAKSDMDISGELSLSWGKEFASEQSWQTNNPGELKRQIQETFGETERKQFRRVLRALKRWRDLTYKNATGHAAPVGVGLTIAGLTMFKPQVDIFNDTQDDRLATEVFVRNLLNAFRDLCWSEKDQKYGRRLEVKVPFAPHSDVFARINNNNMAKLEGYLKNLLANLEAARDAEKNTVACKHMRVSFGEDFPEGDDDQEDTTENSKRHPAVWVPPHTSG